MRIEVRNLGTRLFSIVTSAMVVNRIAAVPNPDTKFPPAMKIVRMTASAPNKYLWGLLDCLNAIKAEARNRDRLKYKV